LLTARAAAIPVDWTVVCAEFRRREFGALRQAASAIAGIDVAALGELFDGDPDDTVWAGQARPHLRHAFDAARLVPNGLSVLAAYLYGLCQRRWEHSIDHGMILRVAHAADRVFDESTDRGPTGGDERLAKLFLTLAVSLASCMATENALNCSCPTDMRRHATAAAAVGRQVSGECAAWTGGYATTGYDFAAQAAGGQSAYFSAVCQAAQAVEEFIGHPESSAPALHEAIDALRRAERDADLYQDVYESELRSHRNTLAAMASLTDVPALYIDEGKVFYYYPFAVLGRSTGEILDRLRRVPAGSTLGRAGVVAAGDVEVTDSWDDSDAEGRRYGGVGLVLGDLSITTTAGTQLPPHQVELRATTVGVCYLRVAVPLANASPHVVNQAMRRGTVHMGAELIRHGSTTWRQLNEYADEVIAALGELLDEGSGTVRIVANVQRRHHAVLSVRAVSMVGPTGRRPVARYEDLHDALGIRLFYQRINHASNTLEEYVRIAHRDPDSLIRGVGFDGEVIVRNVESTVILMPTTPNFGVLYYEEMAEFSAVLPALLDKWTAVIFEQRQKLAAHLPALDAVATSRRLGAVAGDAVGPRIRQLERGQAALGSMITEAQSMLAFVKSPALCQTAKYREVLDSLFEAAGLPALERDLEAQIAQVDALFLRVQSLARQLEERDQRRYRRLVEVMLAFLAVTSLSDLFNLVNSESPRWPLFLEVGTVMALACFVAVVAFRSGRYRN
jgi:CII-binding regulator of phage lambda lysogenization HflD